MADPIDPNAPLQPGDLNPVQDAARQLADLNAIISAKNALISQGADLEKQELDRNKLAEKYAQTLEDDRKKLSDITSLMAGLDGQYLTQARHLTKGIADRVKQLEIAERYMGVQASTAMQLAKQDEIMKSIAVTAERMGLNAEQTKGIQAKAQLGFAKELEEKNIAGWAAAASKIGDVIGYRFQAEMLGAMGRGRGLMTGGGISGATSGGAQNLSNTLFGGAGYAMGPLERLGAMNKILAEAPKAAGETTASMTKLMGTMGYFGANTDKITETLIKGSREAAMSATDISDVYMNASAISGSLGLSVQETSDRLMDMYTSLRQVGGSTSQAEMLLNNFSKAVDASGRSLSAAEKINLTEKFTQGIANIPMDKLMGLAMYTTGKSLQQLGPADITGGSAIGLAVGTFHKIADQMDKSFSSQMIATEKTAQFLGMNVTSPQQVMALNQLLNQKGGFTIQELHKITDPQLAVVDGIDNLKDSLSPLKAIENYTQQIQSILSSWSTTIQYLIPAISAIQLGGGSVPGVLGMAGAGLVAPAIKGAAKSLGVASGLEEGAMIFGMEVPPLVAAVGLTVGAVYGAKQISSWMQSKPK